MFSFSTDMMQDALSIVNMMGNAGLTVQLVMLVLLFFSITSWAIIIIKYRYLSRAYKQSAFFIKIFWQNKNLSESYAAAKQFEHSPVARIFRECYAKLTNLWKSEQLSEEERLADGYIEHITRTLKRAKNTEMTRMIKMVSFLATTGSTAPFIGLFGTVWGIMNSFHEIGARGSASLAVVAPGISEALVATAAGLAVAIPAVIAYNYFVTKIKVIESELNSFSEDLLNIIERSVHVKKGGSHGVQRSRRQHDV